MIEFTESGGLPDPEKESDGLAAYFMTRGKYVVVVVDSEPDVASRHWIITAYLTRRLAEGELEWTRS